jgi:hypothetical protein
VNIQPVHFNLLPLFEDSFLEVYAAKQSKDSRRLLIEEKAAFSTMNGPENEMVTNMSQEYTLLELEAVSSFTISGVFNSIVLNIPQ